MLFNSFENNFEFWVQLFNNTSTINNIINPYKIEKEKERKKINN